MRIIVTIPVKLHHIEMLKAACPSAEFFFTNGRPDDMLLGEAEIIIGGIAADQLPLCKKLRFLQLSMAGSDSYAKLVPQSILLANASGAYGLAISEHMLGVMLMLMKKLHLYRDNQRESLWRDEGGVTTPMGARILIVGLGDIGGEFAKRCTSLGAHCVGIRRTLREMPDYIEEQHTLADLDSLLPDCDVVALALPQSDESIHLFDEKRLRLMKKGAILLNVGRGSAVDSDALAAVLEESRISAGLDVTEPEPLPAEHKLWKCPNCIITPHISGYYHLAETHDRIVRIAAENLSAYLNGGKISNLVDRSTGYRENGNRFRA